MHYLKQISIVIFSLFTLCASAQNVGIGTDTPNNSAILDVSSTNKGLLLPRVADTNLVDKPAEGLLVYNRAERAPSYFDGNHWNNVADARNNYVPLEGSLRYSINGVTSVGGMAVQTGQLPAIDYYHEAKGRRALTGNSQPRGIDSVVLEKEFDGNSIILKRALLSLQLFPSMEILQFMPGASTPFFSIKLSTVRVLEQSFFISEKTGRLTERYILLTLTIGYRDLITGKSFSIDTSTGTVGAY